MIEQRKKEAEALRARFTSCDDISFARTLRDVVVRDPIHRNSSDLSPQLRQVLDQIPIGKLTPPEATNGGVEVFALCGKERTTSETPGKKEARDELYQARFQEQQKRFLAELRKSAMIEYKN
jgi:peptidyl-prolyl cis-trans isomerase SurA